jgi:hypothetical protein
MLRVTFRRILPGKEEHLRAWLAELSRRADEVRRTFVDETVRHEQAFILHTGSGPVLVYAMEAEDVDRGREAFLGSTHPIDAEHKRVMDECLGERVEVETLYDVALEEPEGGSRAP